VDKLIERMNELEIPPVHGPVVGSIRPPGSKSLTNRALDIAAMAHGETRLSGVLDSRDTRVMIDSLRRLGIHVEQNLDQATVSIAPTNHVPASADLWLENSGTSIRFLTAACSLLKGEFRLDGNERMRERPIGPLVDALRQTGVRIRYEGNAGFPPVLVTGAGWKSGRIAVSGDLSSQFLSAILMAAPASGIPVEVEVSGPLVSRPYIDMTLAVMRQFSADVSEPAPNLFVLSPKGYRGRAYDIEPDASAASYFFALAAVTGGEITVEGLNRESLQGDVQFVDALVQMGCTAKWHRDSVTVIGGPLRGIDIDMNAISDTAQTLACVAPFADGPTRIRNVAHMRLKETDRVSAVVTELTRLGIATEEHEDGVTIHPGPIRSATVATYDDHRMAMSFSLIGLKSPGVRIADPGCTAKTYPNYFEDLDRLCAPARQGRR
jgi:3-phosphoshikimate 1-carboxyvinyltransferase